MNYKVKLVETIELALDEVDSLKTPEEKAMAASWFSEFALEAAAALVGYSRLHPDMRVTVRKGIRDKHTKVLAHLKGVK